MIISCISRLLFLHAVTSQLASVWMNYQHFQCVKTVYIQNHRQFIHYQYVCISSVTWACIKDTVIYAYSSNISLDYFCGFIDGQNALQEHTIWNIHVKVPNIHVHFMQFNLSHYYWYCDYEYLKVISNNNISTFCGERYPWVFDALDSSVRMLFSVPRVGSKDYLLELQYYGAYRAHNQHFVIFNQSSTIMSTHFPNMERNEFETFHFISNYKVDIMYLAAMNVCSVHQVVCYDGPGIKSPMLQFTNTQNLSEWMCLSSTFQMWCTFSRLDRGCGKVPHLHYQAKHDINVTYLDETKSGRLQLHESDMKGTVKYMFYVHEVAELKIRDNTKPLFPWMLYEGVSCIYGGIYIVKALSSQDSEILSHCKVRGGLTGVNYPYHNLRNVFVVAILYSGYTSEKITFHFTYLICMPATGLYCDMQDIITPSLTDFEDGMLRITKQNLTTQSDQIYLDTYLLNLREIQSVDIHLEINTVTEVCLKYAPACLSTTIFYEPHFSNIRGRQYDVELLISSITCRQDYIQSIFINMTTCNIMYFHQWTIAIQKLFLDNFNLFLNENYFFFLPSIGFDVHFYETTTKPVWVMLHMLKPTGMPVYVIWRLWIEVCNTESQVSLEVLTDKHRSSSVYKWNHFRNNNSAYITVDEAINIQFISEPTQTKTSVLYSQEQLTAWFLRHFIYDDRSSKYLDGTTPELSFFTFHNVR